MGDRSFCRLVRLQLQSYLELREVVIFLGHGEREALDHGLLNIANEVQADSVLVEHLLLVLGLHNVAQLLEVCLQLLQRCLAITLHNPIFQRFARAVNCRM